MKKNIHVIANYFYPVQGGMEITINEVYSRLSQMGWNVTVHTTKDLFYEKNVLSDYELINGIHVKRYKKNAFGFFPLIDWNNTEAIFFEDFNITAPYSTILLYTSIKKLFRKKKFKLIITPEGGYAHNWSIFPPVLRFIKRTYHQTLGVLLVNFSVDKMRTISLWEDKAIEEYGIKKELLTYIPPGLEKEAFMDVDKLASEKIKDTVKQIKPYIIQIGRMHHLKKYHKVINLLPQVPNINYAIVGSTQEKEYRDTLEELVKKLKLQKRVYFLGTQGVIDKYYLLKHSAMMVHMAEFESFGIVLLEGMSQGTVCITSTKYAMPYVIKDNINGFCVDPENEEDLLAKIKFVLDKKNADKIKDIKKNNIEQSQKMTWDKTALEISKLLTS